MNVLIDTCIIIDALQSREPFNKDAEAVFLSVANRRCVGFSCLLRSGLRFIGNYLIIRSIVKQHLWSCRKRCIAAQVIAYMRRLIVCALLTAVLHSVLHIVH